MEIRVTQSQVGKFNLLSNEESFSFYMALIDDSGKTVEVNGTRAIIHYSGEADDAHNFQDPYGELENIIEMCIDYMYKVTSTRDYKSEGLLFCKLYMENYENINEVMKAKNKAKMEKQLKELQDRLNRDEDAVPNIDWALERALNKQIQQKEKYLQSWVNDLEQIKEGTPKYDQLTATVNRYRKEIDALYELKKITQW